MIGRKLTIFAVIMTAASVLSYAAEAGTAKSAPLLYLQCVKFLTHDDGEVKRLFVQFVVDEQVGAIRRMDNAIAADGVNVKINDRYIFFKTSTATGTTSQTRVDRSTGRLMEQMTIPSLDKTIEIAGLCEKFDPAARKF